MPYAKLLEPGEQWLLREAHEAPVQWQGSAISKSARIQPAHGGQLEWHSWRLIRYVAIGSGSIRENRLQRAWLTISSRIAEIRPCFGIQATGLQCARPVMRVRPRRAVRTLREGSSRPDSVARVNLDLWAIDNLDVDYVLVVVILVTGVLYV